MPAAAEAEQWVQAADVIDLATLKRYRRQHKDLPSGVKEAVLSLEGSIALNRHRLKAIATALGVRLQRGVALTSRMCGTRAWLWGHARQQWHAPLRRCRRGPGAGTAIIVCHRAAG